MRVKADKITQLLDLVGELGLVATNVTHHPDLAGLEMENFNVAAHRLQSLVQELQNLAADLRLVPVGLLFKRMQRLVRDLSRQTGKPVKLTLSGEETQLDKAVVDRLGDPLMHLIRNAIDHGLESPEQRAAAGKPQSGTIQLLAQQQGREILITISDDGRGLNRQAILERARKQELLGPTEEPDDQTVWGFIFHPGFSTARQVSNLSGRGVGMDVVQNSVQALRGRVRVNSQPNEGTQITLHLPLTLAFLDTIVVRVQQQLFAIPVDVVLEILKPDDQQVSRVAANQSQVVRVHHQLVPVCQLSAFYLNGSGQKFLPAEILVIVQTSGGQLALAVDEVLGQQQVTMKPLHGHLEQIRAGIGCAMLPSGQIAIALDCESLSQELAQHSTEPTLPTDHP